MEVTSHIKQRTDYVHHSSRYDYEECFLYPQFRYMIILYIHTALNSASERTHLDQIRLSTLEMYP